MPCIINECQLDALAFLEEAGGLELAAVQRGHKRMTTDEHYTNGKMI